MHQTVASEASAPTLSRFARQREPMLVQLPEQRAEADRVSHAIFDLATAYLAARIGFEQADLDLDRHEVHLSARARLGAKLGL